MRGSVRRSLSGASSPVERYPVFCAASGANVANRIRRALRAVPVLHSRAASKKGGYAIAYPPFLEAPPGIGPGMKVLQTSALPLGYGAVFLKKGYESGFRTRLLERITGLEPATSTLARWRSTK